MLDYSTLGAAVSQFSWRYSQRLWHTFLLSSLWTLDFAIFSAVWQDPENKTPVCWTVEQGANFQIGMAHMAYITAKTKFILYGAYPNESLWRVNSTYLLGAILLGWVMIDRLPYRNLLGLSF